jgi:hypothetical protein
MGGGLDTTTALPSERAFIRRLFSSGVIGGGTSSVEAV